MGDSAVTVTASATPPSPPPLPPPPPAEESCLPATLSTHAGGSEMPCFTAEDIRLVSTDAGKMSAPSNVFATLNEDLRVVNSNAMLGNDCDFLRIPPIDIRPNSAPAVIPKASLKCHAPGMLSSDLQSSGVREGICTDLFTSLGQTGASGLLSTPMQGSLDFNFPVSSTDEDPQHSSLVSIGLEQELRREQEVRGRSLSPKRSQPFDVAAPEQQQQQQQAEPAQKILPSSIVERERPAIQPGNKHEDLAKLRVQQQQLAHQLRSLQEQEWAILERRTSDTSLTGSSGGGGGGGGGGGVSTPGVSSAGAAPAVAAAGLSPSGPPESSPNTSGFQDYKSGDSAILSHSSTMGPTSSTTDPFLHDSFEDRKRCSYPLPLGSEPRSTPPPSHTTTPLSAPNASPLPTSPPVKAQSAAHLLTPGMLDLKNAPPGYRLDPFVGNIAVVAKDQHGCRFLQRLCEEGVPREVTMVFDEAVPHTAELMVDPFGNYLMQKLCEQCSEPQRTLLITRVAAEICLISCEMHGTRAVQKFVEQLRTPDQISIVRAAMSQHTVAMVKDLNANHVIQKCLQKFDHESKQFIYDAVTVNICDVAQHRHGCCVLQRCIDHGSQAQKMQLVEQVVLHALKLVQDPYGNYVVQYVLDLGIDEVTMGALRNFSGSFTELAMNKFSSNVIEKCIKLAGREARRFIFDEICDPRVMPRMLQDQFANYVVQTGLNNCSPDEFVTLVNAIRPFMHLIRNTPHGKKIEMRMQKKPEPTSPKQRDDGRDPGRAKGGGGGGGGGGKGRRNDGQRQRQNSDEVPRGGSKGGGGGGGGGGGCGWGQWQGPSSSGGSSGSGGRDSGMGYSGNSGSGWAGPPQGGGGGGGGGSGGSGGVRGGRNAQRSGHLLRHDAPSYNPHKVELHVAPQGGVPPTAHGW